MTVPFVLDRASEVPIHRQIYDLWRAGILSGRFRRAERIPSSRAFADTYGVARVTVTAAYDQLLAEGYFETKHGSGTFVSSDLPDEALRPIRAVASTQDVTHRIRLSRYASRLGEIQRLPSSTRPLNRLGPHRSRGSSESQKARGPLSSLPGSVTIPRNSPNTPSTAMPTMRSGIRRIHTSG